MSNLPDLFIRHLYHRPVQQFVVSAAVLRMNRHDNTRFQRIGQLPECSHATVTTGVQVNRCESAPGEVSEEGLNAGPGFVAVPLRPHQRAAINAGDPFQVALHGRADHHDKPARVGGDLLFGHLERSKRLVQGIKPFVGQYAGEAKREEDPEVGIVAVSS